MLVAKDTRPTGVQRTTQFAFPVKVLRERCYHSVNKDGSIGSPHIVGIASSDSLDCYMEYFALSALLDMVDYAKSRKTLKDEGLVELRETHWETFAIGTLSDGWVDKNAVTDRIEFYLDVELKEEYPAAMELFNDIVSGVVDKQMSVGGWIDWEKDDDAFEWEEREFADDEGNTFTLWVGRINRFILEHVAVTLPGWAANDDTGFVDAMLKTGANPKFQEFMKKSKEDVMRSLKTTSPPPRGVRGVEKGTDTSLSTTREESHMPRPTIESDDSRKAMKAGELLRTQLDAVPEGELDIVKAELMELLGLTPVEVPEVTNTTDVETTPEVAKTNKDTEPEVVKTTDTEPEVAKTNEEPETPVEKSSEETLTEKIAELVSEIQELRTQITEHEHKEISDWSKKFAGIDTFAGAIVKMGESFDERLDGVEKLNGVSKTDTGELGEEITASPVTTVRETHKSIWTPFLS